MNMATSMIDLSILYGAPVHLFIIPVYLMNAASINRHMQLAKMVIAVLFAYWVQLKEKRYISITAKLILYESLDFF